MIALDGYAVRFRYPGDTAEKSDARHAMSHASIIRKFMRGKLGI